MENLEANKVSEIPVLLFFFMRYPLMAIFGNRMQNLIPKFEKKDAELAALKITERLLCITSNLNYSNIFMYNYTHQILYNLQQNCKI